MSIKINPEFSANKLFDTIEKSPMGEPFALNFLQSYCEKITKEYEQIIIDQNDYVIDLEEDFNKITSLQKEINAKIEKLETEIQDLKNKKDNGTITPEDEKLLETKVGELNDLQAQLASKTKSKEISIKNSTDDIQNTEFRTKTEIATDFAETTIEKGEALTQVQDKHKSFWRKLFNTWDNSKTREFGQNLINTGNNLLEKVSSSNDIEQKLKEIENNSVTK